MWECTRKEVHLQRVDYNSPMFSSSLSQCLERWTQQYIRDPDRRLGSTLTALSGSVPEAEVYAPRLRSTAPLLAQMVYLDGREVDTGSHLGSGKSTLQRVLDLMCSSRVVPSSRPSPTPDSLSRYTHTHTRSLSRAWNVGYVFVDSEQPQVIGGHKLVVK